MENGALNWNSKRRHGHDPIIQTLGLTAYNKTSKTVYKNIILGA